MAKRRMHTSEMWEKRKFAQLTIFQRLLFCALIDLCDDQGRMIADPAYVRSQAFPWDDISIEEMGASLKALEANGSILLYEVQDETYLQIVNWWKYQCPQWASPSNLPPPPNWQDRIRHRIGGHIFSYNWTDRFGNHLADTCDPTGKPLALSQSTFLSEDSPQGLPISSGSIPGDVLPESLPKALGKDLGKDKDRALPERQVHGYVHGHGYDHGKAAAAAAEEKANETLLFRVLDQAQTDGFVLKDSLLCEFARQVAAYPEWEYWIYGFVEAAANKNTHPKYLFACVKTAFEEREKALRTACNGPSNAEVHLDENQGDQETSIWSAVLRELQMQLTRATFDTWLRNTTLVGREEDQFTIKVPTPAAAEWLGNRLRPVVERTLSAVVGHTCRVKFVLSEKEVSRASV